MRSLMDTMSYWKAFLYFPRYGKMLTRLAAKCPEHYFFYMDVILNETIKRHATKSNIHEFGEKKLRTWYKQSDLTHFDNEWIIPESSAVLETVDFIRYHAGL